MFISVGYMPRFGLENVVGTLSLYPYLLQSSLALWILAESIKICIKFGLNSHLDTNIVFAIVSANESNKDLTDYSSQVFC
jgi:hypothetical protein